MDQFIQRLGGIEEQLRGPQESRNAQFFEYLARRADLLPQRRQRELLCVNISYIRLKRQRWRRKSDMINIVLLIHIVVFPLVGFFSTCIVANAVSHLMREVAV